MLNYLAWFNGSPKRIPFDSQFDLIGQVINESIMLDQSTAGRYHSMINITMNQSNLETSLLIGQTKKKKSVGGLLKELYCSKKVAPNTWKIIVVFITLGFYYFFVMFNIENIPGNLFEVGIVFGIAESLGVLIGEKIAKVLPD